MKRKNAGKPAAAVGLGFTVAVSFAMTLGFASWSGAGWLLNGLSDEGLGLDRASDLVTVELLAMGIGILAFGQLAGATARRGMLLSAIAVAVIAQVATALTPQFLLLVVIRAISGVAFGFICSMASVMGAEATDPDRTYAAGAAVQLLIGTIMHPLLGAGDQIARSRLGSQAAALGIALALGVYILLLAAPLVVLPLRGTRPPPQSVPGSSINRPAAAILLFAAMGLFAVASNGFAALLINVGKRVGLDGEVLGLGLAATSFIGASGGIAANRLGLKLGRAAPLSAGLLATGFASLLGITAGNAPVFWISAALWVAATWFTYPYLLGLAAAVDPTGRVASATSGAFVFAGATAAWLVGHISNMAFALLSVIGCAAAVVLSLAAIRMGGQHPAGGTRGAT